MRRFLLFILPVACLFVIGISFYLLETNSDSSLSPIVKVDAATHNRKTIKRIKVTPTPTRIPTATPTPRPTATPTPKPKPTVTPTPTKVPVKVVTPTPTNAPVSSDPIKDYIMQKINDYRSSQGLKSVKTDTYTCDFAKVRAEEIDSSSTFNHEGFSKRIETKTLPYPNYSKITENIAMTSKYQDVVTMWINSSGHAENMRQDTPFVCVEKSGNYYAYEGWKE